MVLLFPRHDRLLGRTDDMIKVKGVNMFPAQIAEVIQEVPGISSEYQIVLDHVEGKDRMRLRFEAEFGDPETLSAQVIYQFKQRIGIKIEARPLPSVSCPAARKKPNESLTTAISSLFCPHKAENKIT